MRKLPLYVCAAAVLTFTSMTNTSYAATANACNLPGGKAIVIGGGSLSDLSSVLGNLSGGGFGSWQGGNSLNASNCFGGSGNNSCGNNFCQGGNGDNSCLNNWLGGNGDNSCLNNWLGGNGNNFCPDNWSDGNGDCIKPNQPDQPNKPDVPNQPNRPNQPVIPDNPNVPDVEQPGNNSTQDAFAVQVVNLVNEERTKAGLSPLTIHTQAESAAMVRAKEIERSFSHTRPDGSNFYTALASAGIRYQSAGENIAYGQMTPQEVMNSWMNSSGHRANILNANYTSIAVAHYQNGSGVHYWVQLFLK